MSSPRISLVIPACNEIAALPGLLDSVDRARAAFRDGPSAVEVVVADNSSGDGTGDLARDRDCLVVSVLKRSIAAARNAGARAAGGEILAFVDADSLIHQRTFDAVTESFTTGRYVAGSTGVTPDRWSPGIAVTYAIFLPLVWLTRMDTGVVFCGRADFTTVPGYDEDRYFAEDVAFLWALKRLGQSRGQRLVRLRGVKAISSTRKPVRGLARLDTDAANGNGRTAVEATPRLCEAVLVWTQGLKSSFPASQQSISRALSPIPVPLPSEQ